MEKLKKYMTYVMPGLLVILLFFANAGTAAYGRESDGTIHIHLKSLGEDEGTKAGVTFYVFRVGMIDAKSGDPSFYSRYGIEGYPQTAAEVEEVTALLLEYIDEEPLLTGETDENGDLLFTGVEDGIYLVTTDLENAYGEIRPFLVHLPWYELIDGVMTETAYQVEVNPKAELPEWPLEEPEDPTPDDPPKPGDPGRGRPVRTGDESNPGDYWMIAGVSLLFIILGAVLKRKEGEPCEARATEKN